MRSSHFGLYQMKVVDQGVEPGSNILSSETATPDNVKPYRGKVLYIYIYRDIDIYIYKMYIGYVYRVDTRDLLCIQK